MPIVWTFPDHHIEITSLSEKWLYANMREKETTAEAVMRLAVVIAAQTPHLRQAVPQLVTSAALPRTRETRNDWTLDASTKQIRDMTEREKEERDAGKPQPTIRP